MGGRAGSGAGGGGLDRDTTYKGQIKDVESLIKMKDPAMYKAAKQAISNFAAKLGIPEKNVKLAKLSGNVMGIGGDGEVYLNKKYFNMPAKKFADVIKQNYQSGHLTKTNKPLAHVINHELAHASWNTGSTSAKAKAAGKEIKALYNQFKRKGGSGYGKYAKSNVDEFWAEVSTKAAHGTSDRYTQKAKQIYKKYKL